MCPRSFFCEKAEIKQRTSLKKELCKIGGEAIWESRFTSFFFLFTRQRGRFRPDIEKFASLIYIYKLFKKPNTKNLNKVKELYYDATIFVHDSLFKK